MQSSYLQDKNWRIRILGTLATGQIRRFPNTVCLIYFICPSGKNTDNIRTREARSKQSRDHILYCPVPTGLNPFRDSQESRKDKKAQKVFNLLLGPTKKRFALELFRQARCLTWNVADVAALRGCTHLRSSTCRPWWHPRVGGPFSLSRSWWNVSADCLKCKWEELQPP